MTLYLSQKKLLILLLSSFALGFLLALIYDIIRLFRGQRQPRRLFGKGLHQVLVSIEDLLFFVFCGVVFSILFFVANSGKVRPSAFVLGLLGFLLYRSTLSRLIFPLLTRLLTLFRRGVAFLLEKLMLPIRRLREMRLRQRTKHITKKLRHLGERGYPFGLRRL